MRLFLKLEVLTTGLAMRLAMAFLIVATALALFQVITRFVFGEPSTWSEVITRSAMIWSVFLGVAPAYRYGSMIAVDIVQHMLPPRLGLALQVTASFLSVVFFAFLFWQGWAMTLRVVNQKLAALDVSIAWAYAALPVGAVFAIIAILGCIVRSLRGDGDEAQGMLEVTP